MMSVWLFFKGPRGPPGLSGPPGVPGREVSELDLPLCSYSALTHLRPKDGWKHKTMTAAHCEREQA